MTFFNSAVDVLQTLVIALGAGLGIWGVINLLEGYGNDNPGAKSQGMKQLMAGGKEHERVNVVHIVLNDNPGAKSQGMKQLMAGGGVALIGGVLVPLLKGLFG